MDRQCCHVYQLPTSDAEHERAPTADRASIDLPDSRPVSLDTPTVTSDPSDSEVTHLDDEQVEEYLTPITNPSITTSPSKKLPWLPYTLRWIPLCLMLVFLLLLELAVLVVHVVSSRNSGLVEDDGSRAVVVGSKFVPTLLAVAFGLLATILLDDVKRTEPFARMASSSGATAKESVTWRAGAWWTIPNPLGPGKLPLFCATFIVILASLAISPLSSTLLVTQVVVFDRKTPFHQLDLSSLAPIQPAPLATTYFRTISNILQNVSTTAWISNNYVVLPFWPRSPSGIPLSPILSDEAQTWSAYTTVFSIDLECKPMEPRWNSPPLSGPMDSTNISITLASKSGCTVNLELGNSSEFFTYGGNAWSGVNNIASRLNYLLRDKHNVKLHGCSENEMLISWTEGSFGGYGSLPNFSISGQACQYIYYVGNSSTTVTMGQGQSIVAVNETEYHLSKAPLAATIANTVAIDNIFFDLNWTVHLDASKLINSASVAESTGPANLLAALYRFSQAQVVAGTSIANNLQRIRKQFFAELLHSAFEVRAVTNAVSVPGTVITSSRRVVVVSAVAIALEVVLLIQAILIATVFYTTRSSNRPLGLTEDPSSIVGVARLISDSSSTVKAFAKYPNGTADNFDQLLTTVYFALAEDQIEAFETSTLDGPSSQDETPNSPRSKSPAGGSDDKLKKPTLFRPWLLALLFVFLSLTLATIAKLYQLSEIRGLYETIFVYNIGVSIGGRNLGSVNPASLLTTLIAVVIGLWWGTFDTTLRKIQPYLALAKSPAPGYKGIAVSYKSSYLLWAAYRAAKRRHWVLLLVSMGAFLAQIFTIAMSSLWTREPGDLAALIPIRKVLELRNVPMVGAGQLPESPHDPDARGAFIQSLFTNLSTSWIYGATTQLTLHGPDPPWSIDGWSFVPSALNGTASQDIQDIGNSMELAALSVNVTMETPAIRGRLECSPYNFIDDQTRWLTKWDLTNKTNWNTTVNPKNLIVGFELGVHEEGPPPSMFYLGQDPVGGESTSFFVNSRRLQCCENKTADSVGLASIGYWSPNLAPHATYPYISDAWPTNFTVKWIHGRPVEGILRAGEWPGDIAKSLLWVEPPQMTALNCQPIIENANSRVTVDSHDGRVLSYEILEEPRADQDAWNSPWIEYQKNLTFSDPNWYKVNITVSHGVLFVTGLLGAADMRNFGGLAVDISPADTIEDTQEQTFNFRQPGLNVDYMTYAMLSLVDFDHQQLLDAAVLERTAQHTFSTMYQHFVNNEVSLTTGGYAYQPLGEKLPDDIGQRHPKSKREMSPANTTGREDIMLQVSRPVELLKISKPAAWICLVILAYLIVSCGTLAIVSRQYNRMLSGPINSIADTAVLVAGSTKLLELAKLQSTSDIKKDSRIHAKLGWFNDAEGRKRWGVELSDKHRTEI
ncbi:hypothetical protein E0Z10_g5028 [Xylaria hypoxylon]|uniref:Uncharacterized protein n=1 Tax=Xylaria hypoxylon TaxID=37992 RepID=A0A4Z0YUW0_9PEZI|nr:hypothetical protein E0Z10_g5028 [Xylaria hypoxylon]